MNRNFRYLFQHARLPPNITAEVDMIAGFALAVLLFAQTNAAAPPEPAAAAPDTSPTSTSAPQSSPAPVPAPQPNSSVHCENPDKDGMYHVGCGVKSPEVIYKVEPEFSNEARKKKFNGSTKISLIVDVNGRPTDIHVVRSASEGLNKKLQKAALSLDQKAMEAVSQYKFTPAMLNGRPVPVQVNVEVNFQIF